MRALQERVAFVEGRVEEQVRMMDSVNGAVASLETRMNGRFEALEARMNGRFETLEARMESRFEAVDRRFETVDHRLDNLDQKVSRHFVWLVGIQVTTLAAMVAALAAIAAR